MLMLMTDDDDWYYVDDWFTLMIMHDILIRCLWDAIIIISSKGSSTLQSKWWFRS